MAVGIRVGALWAHNAHNLDVAIAAGNDAVLVVDPLGYVLFLAG